MLFPCLDVPGQIRHSTQHTHSPCFCLSVTQHEEVRRQILRTHDAIGGEFFVRHAELVVQKEAEFVYLYIGSKKVNRSAANSSRKFAVIASYVQRELKLKIANHQNWGIMLSATVFPHVHTSSFQRHCFSEAPNACAFQLWGWPTATWARLPSWLHTSFLLAGTAQTKNPHREHVIGI